MSGRSSSSSVFPATSLVSTIFSEIFAYVTVLLSNHRGVIFHLPGFSLELEMDYQRVRIGTFSFQKNPLSFENIQKKIVENHLNIVLIFMI